MRAELLLRAAGFTTVLTRDNDRYVSLAERASLGNREEQFALCQHSFQRQRARRRLRRRNLLCARAIGAAGFFAWLPFLQRTEAGPLTDTEREPGGLLQAALVARTRAAQSRDQGGAVLCYCQCAASRRPGGRRFHDEQIGRDEARHGWTIVNRSPRRSVTDCIATALRFGTANRRATLAAARPE